MEGIFILLGLILIILIWIISIYNTLVKLRQHVRDSWAGIETELKRRYNLIPNLVEIVKGYATHERKVLKAVTEARSLAISSSGSPSHQAADENVLVKELRSLFVLSEGYPELKASGNFLELQKELSNTEDRIQASRFRGNDVL